jgi:hypothetical protein
VRLFHFYIPLLILLMRCPLLLGQELVSNNYIFIDVNSMVSPKNFNEILSNDQLLSTQKRCRQKIENIIKTKRGENFTVIYIHDLLEESVYYRRIFNSDNPQYMKDSLFDFRQLSTGLFSDYHIRVIRLMDQLISWGIEISPSLSFSMNFFTGGDIYESKRLQSQYLNRFVQFSGLVDGQSLKLNNFCKINVFYNCINVNKYDKSEISQYNEICY